MDLQLLSYNPHIFQKVALDRGVDCEKSVRIPRFLQVRIQSECGKIRTKKAPNADTFYAVVFRMLTIFAKKLHH